jgi:histidinol-phosphatase
MTDQPSPPEWESRLAWARQFAVEAGKLTLRYFQNPSLQVDSKSDDSPVTIADRQAEELLRDRIRERFPRDAVLGEEFGETPGESGVRWILDPIDGTKSFITGVPLYGTMVGVEFAERCHVGVVYMPGLEEGVFAQAGEGAFWFRGSTAPTPCRISQTANLSQASFVTSQVSTFAVRGAMLAYSELERRARLTRTWGDCYGYLLVATGRVDLMIDPIFNVWDAAAIQPIISEAGGVLTDWGGIETIHGGEGIACNRKLLSEVLDIVRQFQKR